MAKRHPSVIATILVTQQAQRRHSVDMSEREHRQQQIYTQRVYCTDSRKIRGCLADVSRCLALSRG